MEKPFWVYTLQDSHGTFQVRVVDDPSDNLTIGGFDKNGKYHQYYDSYEAYHAYVWAEQHGFILRSQKKTITIDPTQQDS